MNSQVYTAASGLLLEERRVDLVANSLANVSTHGFRARRAFAAALDGVDSAARIPGPPASKPVALAGSYWVPGQGAIESTGNPLDVALLDDQLLAVRNGDGRAYTRNGALHVGADGELQDASGRALLSSDGSPIGGLTAGARIDAAGRVLDGGQEIASLLVVRDGAGVLGPHGDSLLTASGRDDELETVDDPILIPESLEGSAADPVQEMIRLVRAQRAFETYQKAINVAQNEVNRKAVNDLAR